MRSIWLKFSLVLLSVTMAWSATVGTISGRITDRNTGEPIIGAQVMIIALGLGGSTDFEGEFYIQNVPVGVHSVQVWMIGYGKVTYSDVGVVMDQTTPLDVSLDEEVIAGEEVTVIAERPLVEKDVTVKKLVRTAEEIQNLPARDLTEMLTLQSGVIQIKSAENGIPGYADRGIEQIHVRGGRSGEIGYTIDGMYIENPIYGGGFGRGTRLGTHAVQDLISQTGVFNAEYGDAMSQIVNIITATGGDTYAGTFEWKASNLGPISSEQDRLRDFKEFAGSFSGPVIPGMSNLTFLIAADYSNSAYSVYKFDDKVYIEDDPGNRINQANKVHWLDRYSGWRSFGYDRTYDIFTKLHWKIDSYKILNFSHWIVDSKFKTFSPWNQFYEENKNVNHKFSQRFHLEFRHQLNEKTYYTLSASRFTQEMEIDVEGGDMDGDGYPDWVEYKVGTESRGLHNGVDYEGDCDIPYENDQKFGPGVSIANDENETISLESWGPGCLRTMISYYWRSPQHIGGASYDSTKLHIIVQHGEQIAIGPYDRIKIEDIFLEENFDDSGNLLSSRRLSNGNLIDPLDSLEYSDKDGNIHTWHLGDPLQEHLAEGQYTPFQYMYYPDSTYELFSSPAGMSAAEFAAMRDSLYYIMYYEYGSAGADRYRHHTKSVTDEIKFDITSRVNKHHQLRGGVDVKRHLITFDETQLPWLNPPYGETYGLPGTIERDGAVAEFIYGTGEKSPIEIGAYVQDKIEYPWMTINAGIRFDIQNSLDSSWANPREKTSGEIPTDWNVLWSPRLSISHVITNKATFTFGYGRYYQNLEYRNIYLNDDNDLTTALPIVGNSHVQAQGVTAYEFGLNWEFVEFWKLGVVGWSKDYSDLGSTERVQAFPYSYSVVVNYDYGSARGLDLRLIKRGGSAWSTDIQYTLSRATANRADAWQGYRSSDTPESMPKKEVLMAYDRTHNLTMTGGYQFNKKNSPRLFGMYPLNKTAVHVTMVGISGSPYTPFDINLNRNGATNSERMPWFIETNMAIRKTVNYAGFNWSMGLIVRNLLNRENIIDIYEETGSPEDPGRRATTAIENGSSSLTYYDRPYYYSSPRQVDLTVKVKF